MSIKYFPIILLTCGLLINSACSPKRDIVKEDIYGCYPPQTGVYTSNKIDISVAKTVFKDLSIDATNIKNNPEVTSLLNEAAQDQSVREYYHCLAKMRDGWNNEEIAWLDRIIIFSQSKPTSEQLAKFLKDNPFPTPHSKERARVRTLTTNQIESFVENTKNYPKGPVTVYVYYNTSESSEYARQIRNMLNKAGYQLGTHSGYVTALVPPKEPVIGQVLGVHDSANPPLFAGSLQKAFKDINLSGRGSSGNFIPSGEVWVFVGKKPE